MSFRNPVSVSRLPVATGNLSLQPNTKISGITVIGDGTNGGLLQVYDDGAGSDATTLLAEVQLIATEKHKHVLYDPPFWANKARRTNLLYCKLTGTNAVAYLYWE